MHRTSFLLCLFLALAACAPAALPEAAAETAAPSSSDIVSPRGDETVEVFTSTPTTQLGPIQARHITPTKRASPTFETTPDSGVTLTAAAEPLNPTPTPQAWMSLPVVPSAVSQTMLDVYTHGLALGNDPNTFIKIGDCDSTPAWFLGMFEASNGDYSLGAEYAYLQGVIDQFQGSFGRDSAAARQGFNAASVLSPLWADPAQCEQGETPLDCELRIMNPSFALITLGTNDTVYPDNFEGQLRQIIEILLERGVVPILSTKADNIEGDHQINQVIVSLAYEYDLPLWNFWSVVQPLWRHGLQEDHAHLTWASSHFDEPENMEMAFPWRNLTALQTLDAVWRGVSAGQ